MKIVSCPICDCEDLSVLNYKKAEGQDNWRYDCFKDKKLAQCNSCSFVFISETFEEGSLSEFYNTLYSGVEINDFNRAENYEFTARSYSHTNFIKTSIDLADGLNILEIGPNENGMIPSLSLFCNPNYFYYEQLDFPVINHFGGRKLGDYFDKFEATKLSPEQKMDLIVLSHSFEHFEPISLRESVEAMKIALKANGYVSIEVPLEPVTEMKPPHTVLFSVKNMCLLLERNGFFVVATQCIKEPESVDEQRAEFFSSSGSILVKIAKRILGNLLPRKARLKILKPLYDRKIRSLYDGRGYLRVLAQKSAVA